MKHVTVSGIRQKRMLGIMFPSSCLLFPLLIPWGFAQLSPLASGAAPNSALSADGPRRLNRLLVCP
jgi:hypothetical protein